MINERTGDIILSQGTYVYVQDGASGQVDVIVGPHKQSLADTDKPVTYNATTRRFDKTTNAHDAIQIFATANEGEYLVLSNPNKGDETKHPSKGKQTSVDLFVGHKMNIPGPYSIPLYPGQVGSVIPGHQLKSNEYLLVRIYNEKSAKDNFKNAILLKQDLVSSKKSDLINEQDIGIGKLFIINGTDVSFYIPPTGFEVLKEHATGSYVRKAVTLERLEYCILLDQNGDKRFVQGPAVVFPKPTEMFIEQGSSNKFKAIELNDNMGIYIKVIADYTDGEEKYKSGDELFLTGKEQKIYYPRQEHAIIKYGEHMLHYATAVPKGEARYVLNKNTGEVKTISGPAMLLADPRKEVMVRRRLDDKTVALWFPNNKEALDYNQGLSEQEASTGGDELSTMSFFSNDMSRNLKSTVRFSAVADEMKRSNIYSKPRTITLDTKYEGAVRINVWPGYAVQIVKKTGERSIVEGPQVKLLEYDEELEVLELSTGKPKTDQTTIKTAYLQTDNNIVSDSIQAETKDSVEVTIRLSYRVNFDGDNKLWFGVSNYVKLLTQHLRSIVRNKIKKVTIEEFNANAADIIRDLILGESKDGKRAGRTFDENGMNVYDVEVLKLDIGDEEVADLLKDAQQETVEHRLKIQTKEQELEFAKKDEAITQELYNLKMDTAKKKQEFDLLDIQNKQKKENDQLEFQLKQEEVKTKIADSNRDRLAKDGETNVTIEKAESEVRIKEHKEKLSAIQPGLIEAITTLSNTTFADTLAKNLKIQTGGLGGIFPKGGFEGLLDTVKNTPLEKIINKLVEDGNKTRITTES